MYVNIEIDILDLYIFECEVHWLVFIIQWYWAILKTLYSISFEWKDWSSLLFGFLGIKLYIWLDVLVQTLVYVVLNSFIKCAV